MPRLLTAERKDKLLDVLVESATIGEAYINTVYSNLLIATELTEQEFHALLVQFDKHGLVKYDGIIHYGHKRVNFIVHQEAVDFKLHGGFKMEEEIFNIKIENLFDEIENLKIRNPLADFANLTTVATGLYTAAKTIFGT